MRGASALQGALEQVKDAEVSVLVVWLPVIPSDLGPPRDAVLARVPDRRVRQFWDSRRLVSGQLLASGHIPRNALSFGFEDVTWDAAVLFDAGAEWKDGPPRPEWYAGPVVDQPAELVARLGGRPGLPLPDAVQR